MHVYPFNIIYAGRLKSILLLLLMAVAPGGKAQDPDNGSDSANAPGVVSAPGASDSLSGGKGDTAVPDPIVLRSVPDTVLSSYKKDKDFEYANDPAYWKHDSLNLRAPRIYFDSGRPWGLSLRMLIFIIVAGVLIALLYRQYFYKTSLKKTGDTVQEEGVDKTAEWYDDRIRKALLAKDYRMGTRYLFLKALQMLDERQLIHYQTKATNREYVLQMSGHREGTRFRYLADAYDHVWYGDFSLTDQQFGRLHGYFEEFFNALSNEVK